METVRTEGIILHTLPVKDWDLLITAFTKQHGILKFYYKRGQSKKRNKGALTAPLTCAEFVFSQKNCDLIPLEEISVVEMHFELRKTYECLQYSCAWLQLIKCSQLPGKPATDLYQLLRVFLRLLPAFPSPAALHACFQLKLLKHEGLIEIHSQCCRCTSLATYQTGESFCPAHYPSGAIPFSPSEQHDLHRLVNCRSLKEIEGFLPDPAFLEKISRLYQLLLV